MFDGSTVEDSSILKSALLEPVLNRFASLPQQVRSFTRQRLIDLLEDGSSVLFNDKEVNRGVFINAQQAKLHLPLQIGGFADFLCSETHHDNVSTCPLDALPRVFEV